MSSNKSKNSAHHSVRRSSKEIRSRQSQRSVLRHQSFKDENISLLLSCVLILCRSFSRRVYKRLHHGHLTKDARFLVTLLVTHTKIRIIKYLRSISHTCYLLTHYNNSSLKGFLAWITIYTQKSIAETAHCHLWTNSNLGTCL